MRHYYRKNAPVLYSILASLLLFLGGFAVGVEEGDKAPDLVCRVQMEKLILYPSLLG